jgi:hypothetical protein
LASCWRHANEDAGVPPAKTVSPVRELMRDWGLQEWGHAKLGFAACCAFAWALELPV